MRRLIGMWVLATLAAPCGLLAQSPPPDQQPAQQQPAQQQPSDQPPPKEDDPGRPVLRHGGPAKKRTDSGPAKTEENIPPPLRDQPKDDSQPVAAGRDEGRPTVTRGAAARPADDEDRPVARKLPPAEALIEKARDAAFEYVDSLPNFICDQITKRYMSKTIKPDWKYRDRVEVELIFNNGKEDYRNVRLNGRALKKGSPEDSGQWSTGEFGTVLADIFHPATRARFKLRGDSTASGMKAKEYEFSVSQPDSHWTIRMGYPVKPAYSGSVWIEPETGRVLRIEMGTTSLPTNYDVDKVESVVDYEWVDIGGKKYLMPVRSQNLACETHMFNCTKNEIEFKNYRKFNVESQVLAVDSDITFPEEEESGKKKPEGKPQRNYDPPQITVKPEETPKESEPPKQQ